MLQLRVQSRLLRFQGFDVLGTGVEFTLLQIGQSLARLFNDGQQRDAELGGRRRLTRLAPVTVAAHVLTHTIALEGWR